MKKAFAVQHAAESTVKKTDPSLWIVLSGTAWTRGDRSDGEEQGDLSLLTSITIAASDADPVAQLTANSYFASQGDVQTSSIVQAAQSRRTSRKDRLERLLRDHQVGGKEKAIPSHQARSSSSPPPAVSTGDLLLTHMHDVERVSDESGAGLPGDRTALGRFKVSVRTPSGHWGQVNGLDFGSGLFYSNEIEMRGLRRSLTSLLSERAMAAQKYYNAAAKDGGPSEAPPLHMMLLPATESTRNNSYFFGDRVDKLNKAIWK